MIESLTLLSTDRVGVQFSQPMHPGSRLIIGLDDSESRVCLGYLPGDVNADGTTASQDLLALIDGLNGVADPPLLDHQCDINRSGACEPQDSLTCSTAPAPTTFGTARRCRRVRD